MKKSLMKMIFKKKTVSVLLIVSFVFSSFIFTSCNRKYDEGEVLAAAEKLIKDAQMLNLVYYGSGIEWYDTEEEKGYYKIANEEHLDSLGFKTIDELKAITEKTFSDEYSNLIYTTILSPLTDGTAIVSPARYYQGYDEETKELTDIMVYSNFTPMWRDSITYDFSSLKVEGAKKEKVYVTINVTVTNSRSETQNTAIKVTLVEEEDGWKIDSPTYVNYNEYQDRYDELNNQKFNK